MSVFDPSPFNTPEKIVAHQVDQSLQQAAIAMKNAYDQVRALVYANPNFPNPNDVYTAFQTYSNTGLKADDLGKAARLVKTVINQFASGTIVDDVPEVTIGT